MVEVECGARVKRRLRSKRGSNFTSLCQTPVPVRCTGLAWDAPRTAGRFEPRTGSNRRQSSLDQGALRFAICPTLLSASKRFLPGLQQRAADHDSLDFGRPFADFAQPRVTPATLHVRIARVAPAAANLQGAIARA